MSQASRVLEYLRSLSPGGATNSEIGRALAIQPHQAVFAITQELRRQGHVRGERDSRAWTFYATDASTVAPDIASPSAFFAAQPAPAPTVSPATQFESVARRVMSVHFGTLLGPDMVPGVRKQFDFVSGDRTVVGDAKFYSRVNGTGTPPAKLSAIAEYVWLLEKTGAPIQFPVFGNDRAVPMMWLAKYGALAPTVSFYFLSDDGTLELLPQTGSSSVGASSKGR